VLINARALVRGEASGPLLLLDRPLSLWGGVNLTSGEIVDRTHPQGGEVIAGMIVAMWSSRGSSSSSSALAEMARSGLAPAAILLARPDPVLTIGALVAADLYGADIPIGIVDGAAWAQLRRGMKLKITSTHSGLLISEM
jgi:predicted aconitase with swiveling domain